MWDERNKKARNGRREDKVFQVWRAGPQEIGMPKEEREEERRGSATTKSVEEDARTLWHKRFAFKGSKDNHRRVDYQVGGGDTHRIQRV